MFKRTSRYFNLPTSTITVKDRNGDPVEIRFLQRRFIPSTDGEPVVQEHRFSDKDRLDTVTARYLDDPTLFWRVCDANLVLRPEELEQSGRVIRITLPNT